MTHAARWLVAALLAVVALAPTTPAYADAPVDPGRDAFYTWAGGLDGVAPGTVLRQRRVQVLPSLLALRGGTSWQVLYRTTGQLGQPKLAVATIMRPTGAKPGKLVSFQTHYDGLGTGCLPSYTLRGGNPGNAQALSESAFMATYLAAGYTVVTADYETVTSDYTTGQESGRATLDGIRATRDLLALADGTRVAMLGYSGGSIASEYAAELAPTYAPELNLVGTAAGGVPVDYEHLLAHLEGNRLWSGTFSYLFTGLSRGFETDLGPWLTARGAEAIASVQDRCLDATTPAVGPDEMFTQDYMSIPAIAAMVRSQTMGRGTPAQPMLLANGNSDGTGDGIMLAADVRDLAATYCARGVPTTYREYAGADHVVSEVLFALEAHPFVTGVLEGRAPSGSCP